MTVRATVEDHRYIGAGSFEGARAFAAKSRNYLPFLIVFLIVITTVVFAMSCKSPTMAFRNNSNVATLNIELVESPEERAQGLMNRESLEADDGMLFDFGREVDTAFWMKDTTIPLSIAFIDSDGKVIGIQDMTPLDESPVRPPGEYRYAVEANQGWFRSHGIEPGATAIVDL